MSASGRYIAFESAADNLVAGDTNDNSDVFLRDRKVGTTRRMSLGPQGVQGNGPSRGAVVAAGGRFVGFSSLATNLVANDAKYNPTAFVDPYLLNPWGIALRPPGAGGHFWTSNAGSGTTTTYIGDVPGVPLYQDGLKVVPIVTSERDLLDLGGSQGPTDGIAQVTGQVYNAASDIVCLACHDKNGSFGIWAYSAHAQPAAHAPDTAAARDLEGGTVEAGPPPAGLSVATFAGGCFWGTEDAFRHVPGVLATAVGYVNARRRDGHGERREQLTVVNGQIIAMPAGADFLDRMFGGAR